MNFVNNRDKQNGPSTADKGQVKPIKPSSFKTKFQLKLNKDL